MKKIFSISIAIAISTGIWAQTNDPIIDNIITEANKNSQLETLGHQLMDEIGPRLVGTPQIKTHTIGR